MISIAPKLDDHEFAYLEYVAVSRLYGIREAMLLVNLRFNSSDVLELILHIADLHAGHWRTVGSGRSASANVPAL